jgi:transcriptional regulator with XRE-family HTH domain
MVASCAYLPLPDRRDDSRMLTNLDIGRAIDRLRLRQGVTKKKLAEMAGEMDPGNLNRIIRGTQEATTGRLELLASALGVKVWEILRLAEDGTPPKEGDPRKAALHDLIESIDPSQLDSVFRRWPDEGQQSGDPASDQPVRRKA